MPSFNDLYMPHTLIERALARRAAETAARRCRGDARRETGRRVSRSVKRGQIPGTFKQRG